MNLYQAQRAAKDRRQMDGEFMIVFPVGPRKCRWIDPYFGFFEIDGIDGFVRVDDIDRQYPDLHVLELS